MLPQQCAYLQCQESLIAGESPLLPGAVNHEVSHPEELTLAFVTVYDGAECCILPHDARIHNGSMIKSGYMVEEGLINHNYIIAITMICKKAGLDLFSLRMVQCRQLAVMVHWVWHLTVMKFRSFLYLQFTPNSLRY